MVRLIVVVVSVERQAKGESGRAQERLNVKDEPALQIPFDVGFCGCCWSTCSQLASNFRAWNTKFSADQTHSPDIHNWTSFFTPTNESFPSTDYLDDDDDDDVLFKLVKLTTLGCVCVPCVRKSALSNGCLCALLCWAEEVPMKMGYFFHLQQKSIFSATWPSD